MTTDDTHLDGNAAAGAIADALGLDVTTMVGTCAGCGRQGPLARAHAYLGGPGTVLRCDGCDQVLLRLARTPGGSWLDLRGLAVVRL